MGKDIQLEHEDIVLPREGHRRLPEGSLKAQREEPVIAEGTLT